MDTKKWWESKTIWVQIIAVVFALGAQFKWWPTDLTQDQIVSGVMALVAVVTVVLRFFTTKSISS